MGLTKKPKKRQRRTVRPAVRGDRLEVYDFGKLGGAATDVAAVRAEMIAAIRTLSLALPGKEDPEWSGYMKELDSVEEELKDFVERAGDLAGSDFAALDRFFLESSLVAGRFNEARLRFFRRFGALNGSAAPFGGELRAPIQIYDACRKKLERAEGREVALKSFQECQE